MGERSYLAIGDVLALLREEFPDITISKIRFLESRGLLVPERTPSGYRKFYEPDVDRLRWILRQQREHFLPLKVIKGRLDNGMSDPEAPAPHLFEMGDPPPEQDSQAVLVGVPGELESAREHGEVALSALASIAVGSSSGGSANRASPPVLASRDAPAHGAHASGRDATDSSSGSEPGSQPPSPGAVPPEPDRSPSVSTGSAKERRSQAKASEPAARSRKPASETDTSAESAAEEPAGFSGPARRASTRSTAGLPGAALSGASLTLVELANASGLNVEGIEELESFGLIAGRTVAGVHCYDEETVHVAKIAAGFARYGIEARHLRVFKHAADRQTGLFAQVVMPLLRQRNPESRVRAIDDLAELAELGEALMRCFSQAALRELTGG